MTINHIQDPKEDKERKELFEGLKRFAVGHVSGDIDPKTTHGQSILTYWYSKGALRASFYKGEALYSITPYGVKILASGKSPSTEDE